MKNENIIISKKTGLLMLMSTVLLIAGCASTEFDDINQWMKEKEKSMKGKIEPLPEAKRFIPITFSAEEDPFVQKPTLSLNELEKNKYAPDPSRRKEPLESFTLDSLKMTGSLYKDKKFYAVIKNSDNIVSYATIGNYVGTNYGKIIKLEEGKITLQERVRDSGEQWKEQETVIFLDEGNPKK